MLNFFHFMQLVNKISRLASAADLTKAEISELVLNLHDVQRLEKFIHKRKRAKPDKYPQDKLTKRPRQWRQTLTWCRYCNTTWPHTTREAFSQHMRVLQRRFAQSRGAAHWRRVGFDVMAGYKNRAESARSLVARTARFKMLAPRAARTMSNDAIVAEIDKQRDKRGWMNDFARFDRWVRRNYA